MSRTVRCLVLAALATTLAPAPARAGSHTHADTDCDWGEVGSALFTEDAGPATWTYHGVWEIDHWYGNETKDGPDVTAEVAGGTLRLHSESSSSQRLVRIEVASTGLVSAASGVRCEDPPVSCGRARGCAGLGETPLDDVVTVPVPVPDGVPDPGPVGDVLDPVLRDLDPALCAAVRELRGEYPGFGIDDEGDLSAAGTDVWDCPPYGS